MEEKILKLKKLKRTGLKIENPDHDYIAWLLQVLKFSEDYNEQILLQEVKSAIFFGTDKNKFEDKKETIIGRLIFILNDDEE